MVYKFRRGAFLPSGIDAQQAGEQCERLAAEGRLTAKTLVEESRPETAPLHKAFEWRDSVAAQSWREHQARHIMASLELVKEDAEPVRAFFNIVRAEPEYRPITAILENEDATAKLLETALREFEAYRRKYNQLTALAGLFEAYDKLGMDETA